VSLIIGKITSTVDVFDDKSGIAHVDFLVDDEIRHSDDTFPYEWIMEDIVWGKHTLCVTVSDIAGNVASEKRDMMIFTR
jgi:hypothetical protein